MDHSEPSQTSERHSDVYPRCDRREREEPDPAPPNGETTLIPLPPPMAGIVIAIGGFALAIVLPTEWSVWVGSFAFILGIFTAITLKSIGNVEKRCGIVRRGCWWRPWKDV